MLWKHSFLIQSLLPPFLHCLLNKHWYRLIHHWLIQKKIFKNEQTRIGLKMWPQKTSASITNLSSLERKGKGNGIDDWETVAIIRCHLLLQPISLREEKCEESEESYWLKQSYYYPAIHLCKSNTLWENTTQLIWLEIYLTFNITA